MPHKIKVQAKEVSLAIEKGLKELGLRRDQVEVSVLENPRKGFLGIGARPAVVELRQKRWVSGNLDAQIYMDVPKKKSRSSSRKNDRGGRGASRGRKNDRSGSVREIKRGGRRAYASHGRTADNAPHANEKQLLPCEQIQNAVVPEYLKAPLQEAKDFLNNVLSHMGVQTENLNAWWDEKQQRILLTFDCDHPAIVIGKEGKTLESLQYLATLSLSRHFDKPISVIADTQNYWRKAEDKINSDLEYGINQIKNGYSVYRFRPMSAQLRRYIHRAAENNEFVITVSEGEGQWRKVTLRPRPADQPVQKETQTKEVISVQTFFEETAASSAPVEQAPSAVSAELPQTEPAADNAQGATCQAELARNCADNEVQTGCACESSFQTPQQAEETAPAVSAQPEQTPAAEPAASEVAQTPVVADDAQGGTCQAELARNCADNEVQTGCACGPLFETPAQTEAAAPSAPAAEPAPAQDGSEQK